MSCCVRRNIHLLHILSKNNKTLSKNILKSGNTDLIDAIWECALNIQTGNIKLKKNELTKLKKYKKQVRGLVQSPKGGRKRRNIIIQSGNGFLPALLAPLISVFASLLFQK